MPRDMYDSEDNLIEAIQDISSSSSESSDNEVLRTWTMLEGEIVSSFDATWSVLHRDTLILETDDPVPFWARAIFSAGLSLSS